MKKTLLLAALIATPAFAAPQFQPIDIDFDVKWDKAAHPFTGAAAIDINGDGADEVFIGGGLNQEDRLYTYHNGELEDIIGYTGLSSLDATHGVTSFDLDSDGDVDLVAARAGGITIYLNDGEGNFTGQELEVEGAPYQAEPFQVAVTDYDRDGDVDFYISYFTAFPYFKQAQYHNEEHSKKNVLLRNDGGLSFTNVTEEAGVAGYSNSFGAISVDLNGDRYDDIIVAQNAGPVQLFENNQDGTFTERKINIGSGFWMGIGVGDIDHDGDQDLFFPNAGVDIPELFTSRGAMPGEWTTHDWSVQRNDGNFEFTEVVSEVGLDRQGFAWGGVFEDVDLDGNLDLFVAQNYVKWPIHEVFKRSNSSFLFEDGKFEKSNRELGLQAKRFGQSSLFVDLDGDGDLDYFWINMNDKQDAYLNTSTEDFISFRFPDDLAHLGTTVYIETENGRSYTRQLVAGQGYLTDQATELVFGLGDATKVERAVIEFPNGRITEVFNPAINKKYSISL